MVCLSNSTTSRLEGYSRARGMELGIVKSPDNSAGLFFITAIDNRPLSRWISLGWTVNDAHEALDRRSAGMPEAPSPSGYVFHQ